MIQQKKFKEERLIITFCLILLFPIISFSQNLCHTADIDNDGDSDIVAADKPAGFPYYTSIVWFENTDGIGHFMEKSTVSTDFHIRWVSTADFDRDGDIDILAVDYNEDEKRDYIVWLENENTIFQDRKIITDEGIRIQWLDIGDLDQDGDMDIVCAEYSYSDQQDVNQVCWYEQLESGVFSSKKILVSYISNYAYHPSQIHVVDINGDTYPDIVAPSDFFYEFIWLSNSSGTGIFDAHWIVLEDNVYMSGRVNDFMSADLDGDGDIDFLLGLSGAVKWLENQDGLGSFGSEKTITEDVYLLSSVYAADLDGDSDLDVMSAARVSTTNHFFEKAWYENMGGADTFGVKQSIEKNSHTRVWAADMDGDGNFDYISASGSEINWRLNLDGLGTFGDPITTSVDKETSKNPESFQLSQNFPNPFNPVTTIAYQLPEDSNVSLKIFNNKGEVVKVLIEGYKRVGSHKINWDGRDEKGVLVPSGIYLYQITTSSFSQSNKMLLIR
ncbi:VCBS repeat-containing protein [candidate division KSB1 bacterium]|nr:VCBS repeat-containing protein [candidate division KSB1 bacterium]